MMDKIQHKTGLSNKNLLNLTQSSAARGKFMGNEYQKQMSNEFQN